MIKVYAAGPMANIDAAYARSWRSLLQLNVGNKAQIISPTRGSEHLEFYSMLGEGDSPLRTSKGLTTRDRFDVQRCDIVFANFLGATKPSLGTCIEFGWADAFGKPVIAVMDKTNPHQHAMMNEIAGYIVPTLEEGIQVLKGML